MRIRTVNRISQFPRPVRVDLFEWLSLQLTDAWTLRGGLARLAQERSTWALEQARIRYQTKCYDALPNTKTGPNA